MKVNVLRLALSLSIALAASTIVYAQEVAPQIPAEQRTVEEQLVDRFNKALGEKLDDREVSLTFSAGKYLDYLVKRAARVVIQENKMNDLDKADENFRLFASRLIEAARLDSRDGRITDATIDKLMMRGVGWNPNPVGWGICPLFPICK